MTEIFIKLILGFLLTGGDSDTGKSTHILSKDGEEFCVVEELPAPRSYHTTDNILTCGGVNTSGMKYPKL